MNGMFLLEARAITLECGQTPRGVTLLRCMLFAFIVIPMLILAALVALIIIDSRSAGAI